jgi:hypothetical protein
MNKNAYEIRLDIFKDAHEYCRGLFQHKLAVLSDAAAKEGKTITAADVEKIYPTKTEILATAELFYDFVSSTHNK